MAHVFPAIDASASRPAGVVARDPVRAAISPRLGQASFLFGEGLFFLPGLADPVPVAHPVSAAGQRPAAVRFGLAVRTYPAVATFGRCFAAAATNRLVADLDLAADSVVAAGIDRSWAKSLRFSPEVLALALVSARPFRTRYRGRDRPLIRPKSALGAPAQRHVATTQSEVPARTLDPMVARPRQDLCLPRPDRPAAERS